MTLPVVFTANGPSGYNLTKSLRFRSSASAYLNRTPASASGENQWTFSTWVKRGSINGSSQQIIGGNTTTSGGTRNVLQVEFGGDNTLQVYAFTNASGYYFQRVSNAVYRDPSAWYHLVVQFDPDNGTSANRIIAYINGQQVSWGTSSDSGAAGSISSSAYRSINNTYRNDINGGYQGGGAPIYFGDGYLAETIMVSGSLVSVSSFGETSTSTGVWIPKKYTGTYGTNGFYLKFTDTTSTSTLGTDFSGNSNTWTVNNISLTSGSTYDSMTDVPTLTSATTANYCTLNAALQAGGYTLNDGNLNWARTGATGGTNDRSQFGTIGVTSGKWYWEFTAGTVNANSIPAFGIAIGSASTQSWGGSQTGVYIYESDGLKYLSGTGSSYGASFATGDIIGIAFDADAGTLTFYKNNTSQGQAASGLTSGPYFPAVTRSVGGGGSNGTEIANFGQRPFSYTPPTGFVALNTFNLPTPTIGATASSQANKYMDATLYTGNGSTQTITNAGSFQPDWVWLKSRSNATDNELIDAVRGATKSLVSNSTAAEATDTNGLTAFNSNGFALGTDANYNGSTRTYVAWQWRASNATAVTNTAGSITSTVSANTSAGFSIVTYTGNGTSGATVGHGLGVAPSMVIVKSRSLAGYNWAVRHITLGTNDNLALQDTSAAGDRGNGIIGALTSTTFEVKTNFTFLLNVNGSTETYVAYCFAQIAGYSAFGSYTGNGSATDGPFVYLGFRPRFVMVKRTDSTGNWSITDTAINPYNNTTGALRPNTADSESTVGTVYVQPLSNGFKITNNNTDTNASSGTYIYACFAETPFRYANAR